MGKNMIYILLGLIIAALITSWAIDNNNSKAELRAMQEKHAEEMDALQRKYDSLADLRDYLKQKGKDEKKELNETKKQIKEVTVTDFTSIEPDARADSIRAIINR